MVHAWNPSTLASYARGIKSVKPACLKIIKDHKRPCLKARPCLKIIKELGIHLSGKALGSILSTTKGGLEGIPGTITNARQLEILAGQRNKSKLNQGERSGQPGDQQVTSLDKTTAVH